jgi:hypothetical protein
VCCATYKSIKYTLPQTLLQFCLFKFKAGAKSVPGGEENLGGLNFSISTGLSRRSLGTSPTLTGLLDGLLLPPPMLTVTAGLRSVLRFWGRLFKSVSAVIYRKKS